MAFYKNMLLGWTGHERDARASGEQNNYKTILYMKISCYVLLLIFCVTPHISYSQTDEYLCLKTFNKIVYRSLINIDKDKVEVSFDKINIIFELYVLNCGRIDSINIKKSNLNDLSISEATLISSITGQKLPCLRDVYYNLNEIPPDKIIIIYNANFLKKE